ncbi:DnaD domain protein [Amphibacillus sp. MSJ-3]|uniref:replication initiation and membrane attachment family protein n=1 Tax=Amphibacillus sp. MSJ-3 TaxID=2841505 RepID=UPI001C0EB5D8|nr:DnaD domain protein [Amphibacillus sp. MSJ-3]MBU5593649.1 DnaD domain protein [Amphibacillus sp. MSJ-3]
MHPSIGKILPSDYYSIKKDGSLTQEHYQALYQLYQPIIGVVATALYLTLHHLFQTEQKHTHHQLMQVLNQPLDAIYQARKKCEAIGLLTTYQLNEENYTVFNYELITPLTTREFLSNDLLNQLLLHQIGPKKHKAIKDIFTSLDHDINHLGKNITTNFSDVFAYNLQVDQENTQVVKQGRHEDPIALDDIELDWKWIEKMLEDRMLPADKILSVENRKLITQMAAFYQLTSTQLDKAIQWSISSDHELNREEFKLACLDLVEVLPEQINVVNQRDKLKTTDQRQKTKKELFIERMETISPKELLEDLSNGHQASQQDLKMVANVMDSQGLEPGVMNVLIHYVMLKTDMKLTKSYLEKIASHWSRKNVKTVQQAMTLAKSENNKYQQWDQKKQANYYRPKNNQDIVPDWFKKQKKNQKKQTTSPVESDQDINEILKAFKNKKTNE